MYLAWAAQVICRTTKSIGCLSHPTLITKHCQAAKKAAPKPSMVLEQHAPVLVVNYAHHEPVIQPKMATLGFGRSRRRLSASFSFLSNL